MYGVYMTCTSDVSSDCQKNLDTLRKRYMFIGSVLGFVALLVFLIGRAGLQEEEEAMERVKLQEEIVNVNV